MMKRLISIAALALATVQAFAGSWVRINQIGYLPSASQRACIATSPSECATKPVSLSILIPQSHIGSPSLRACTS